MDFFDRAVSSEVVEPNGCMWWHSAPLPGGRRVQGAHHDKDRQFKVWEAMGGGRIDFRGKRVLDIGANDGFYSIASALCGAEVTSIDANWLTWPKNINFLADSWQVRPDIITGDFRKHQFGKKFDIIFFLGVIYHVENIFACMALLKELLVDGGVIYLETHLTGVAADTPIWEAASDLFKTSAPQGKSTLDLVGISNFLLPNAKAIVNLAHTFDLKCVPLIDNAYCKEDATRGVFRLQR